MEFKDIVSSRRSVNYFDIKKPVADNLIREIVEMAAKTPSSFNLQPWRLMILKDPGEKMRLRKLAWDQPKVTEAPVVFILLADRDAWKEGHPFVIKNFNEMLKRGNMSRDRRQWYLDSCKSLYGTSPERQQAFACKNTGFFAMSLMYAAKSLGLDTHPIDGFDHDAVRKAFNIPKNYWIPLLLALGYFNENRELHPPKWRKSFKEIVFD
jgi:nitroreductase